MIFNHGVGDTAVTSTVDNFIALSPPVSYGQKRAFAAVGAICLVLTTAATLMRTLTSRRSGEKTTAQDWTYGAGIVTFVAFVAASIAMFSFGDQANIMAYAGASVASAALYSAALVLLRIAMLCLYQDVLFSRSKYWRFSFAFGGIFTVYSIVFVIADGLQCKPGTPVLDMGRCINIADLEIVIGMFDFITLAIILALPVKGMWQGRQHPDVNNHICYPIAFTLGFIACIMSLVHAVAPRAALTTWSLLYPLSGLITLTLMILSFAIIGIPTFIRCRTGPIQSPTTTHPHLHRAHSRSASVLSWIGGAAMGRGASIDTEHDASPDIKSSGKPANVSADTLPSVSDVTAADHATDVEKSTEALSPAPPDPVASPAEVDGRTNSMRSFTRLGSLTGLVKPPSFGHGRTGSLTGSVKPPSFMHGRSSSLTGSVKPPSFLANRSRSRQQGSVPEDLDLSGITVKTEVQMRWEERRKALSRGHSRSASHDRDPRSGSRDPRSGGR